MVVLIRIIFGIVLCILYTYVQWCVILLYLSTECIELITANSEVQSTTNVVTTITTAITHTTTNTTITTASVVTSSSASVAPPTTAQITSSQNSAGMYVCAIII